ncbi:alpha/beta hydrolase [Bacillus sp. FJAT-47783]|uniref:alpha/beta hydrolase n=1 Tax=Bacillus sp. FJAT-47783 TaxID=2922712 RepID=UPI001FABF3DD|nr:alpha/beta hydrolase [Bacillus sp. FJAT-47783]
MKKKQVLFIHSAGVQGPHQGSTNLASYLQKSFGDEYNLLVPKMPNPENPEYTLWKAQLAKELTTLNNDIILIGHSLGSSVLLKYLSEEVCQLSISGLFMISAPYWGKDEDWQNNDYTLRYHFALKLPPISEVFFYHSRNDEIVPFAHVGYYAENLPQATVRALDGDEHFFNDGLPELVSDIKSL